MHSEKTTVLLKPREASDLEMKDLLLDAFDIMRRAGYEPINQLIGFVTSGDIAYITSKENLRKRFSGVAPDDVLKFLLLNCVDVFSE